MSDNKAWTGKTGGTAGMQRSLIRIFARIDQRWLYPVVAVWILFYILFQPAGTRGIYYYWRRRRGMRPLQAAHHTYWNYFCFGTVILDRFAAYAGKPFDIRIDGEEVMSRLASQPGGFIVISSHVGNQELAGYSIHSEKPMYVLLYMGDTQTVNQNRERMFNAQDLHFIPMMPDGSHIFEMHQVLDKGNVLSIHGDRMFYGGRSISTPLMGEDAPFPEGPYKVAAIERVPVVTMFMMKEKSNRYTLYIRQLATGEEEGSNMQRAHMILERFVAEEEALLNKYPHQWFHFYHFWRHQ